MKLFQKNKGAKMKEKISTFLTLSVIFSLFVYYKVVKSPEIVSSNQIIETIEYDIVIDDVVEEQEHKDIQVNTIMDVAVEDACNLGNNETNNFKFSNAFKYYRNCYGKNQIFTWNNQEYSTLYAEEINAEKSYADSNNEQKESDKFHLELLNDLLGVNVQDSK